ncbi:LAGLIDADG family homing endonuclease [Thermus scotoductus]|uniref:Ribonucleoside-diphosphate reductase n=1 Tax=Thermus scotoductus TaxID=37636 RepID=A0A430R0G5_THESC|nr:LAGLIDADG family homing endonuclease [Thermus scotoductus]RTG92291.1 ribonucleoside-diphosphate reductase [Thermus scotoductus]RTH00896.1 ribonucleoside-diphosphate reductase [Thermus scotoductus]RTH15578.1 ribonucleoside-diphosphate reductase [Thermus scotoductus]RTI01972.1 ribonucleoside-diphosphate reductase [Thermus scotoductus]RTI18711.1 ribonucleoside-diphosphate reductase [Thermus scotoductus]
MERFFFDDHAQAIARRQYFQEGDGDILGMFRRVAREIAKVEKPEDRVYWEEKFYDLMASKRFSPGGRILAGAGTPHGNLLNCFVQGATQYPPESFNGIMEVAKKLALVTKVGGGNGVNLDPYRSKGNRQRQAVRGVAYLSARHPDVADFIRGLMRPPTNPEGEKEEIALKNFVRAVYGEVSPELRDLAERYGVLVVQEPPPGAIQVPDDMGGIVEAAKAAAALALKGLEPHVDFSLLRPEGAPIRGSGGTSSGPVSFLMEIFDNFLEWAALGGEEAGPVATLRYVYAPVLRVVRQGGTRRGAGMATLSIEHPDLLDFLTAKDLDREKAEGDISTFNISVLVTEAFMKALEEDALWPVTPIEVPGKYYPHPLGSTYTGQIPALPEREDGAKPVPLFGGKVPARWLWHEIAWHAWATGEPGLIFVDRINELSALKGLGPRYQIRSTNPCFVGSTRIPTERGLVPIEELAQEGGSFYLVTDARAPLGGMGRPASGKGAVVRKATQAFFTGVKPVVRLRTREGLELTLTPDHLLLTPRGYKEAGSLKPGDKVLVQSGEGLFPKEDTLPAPALAVARERVATAGGRGGKGRADVREKYHNLPTHWSRELGIALGWLLGDGYLREDGVGFYFSRKDFAALSWLPDLLRDWFGGGSLQETPSNTFHLHFNRIPAEFFQALGVKVAKATEKRVPESLFRAPREAVVGFLQGLFSADGSVQVNKEGFCSVRLSSSSTHLLQDVQLLLLNLGIYARIYLRRQGSSKDLPDGRGGMKSYTIAPQYELIIYGADLVAFAQKVGFLQPEKNAHLGELASRKRRSRHAFQATVKSVEPAGEAPVYDLTEPVTHSLIANGVVAHNCGEVPLTVGEPCDLGALNLAAYVKDGEFQMEEFRRDVHTAIRFLDNVLDVNRFALPDNEEAAKKLRRLGLGVMGLADALIKMGLPYSSEEAREKVYEIMSAMREEAIKASEALAKERGVFPLYEAHQEYFEALGIRPRRNVALLTVAPTGTTSMVMGVSSGIEPVFSPFVWRRIGGEYKPLLHPLFVELMETYPPHPDYEKDGKWDWEKIIAAIQEDGHGSVKNLPFVPEAIRRVFECAHDIHPLDHVRMQGAVQRAFDAEGYAANSLSKTINLPNHATVEEVEEAYLEAYRTGCKGITVYRDGSREFQVLTVRKEEKKAEEDKEEAPLASRPAPQAPSPAPQPGTPMYERPGRLMGFTDMVKLLSPDGGKRSFLVTVNMLGGRPIEVILTSGKAGDEANADSEALGRVVSIALQYGVPAEAIVRTLRGINGGLYGTYQGRLVSSKADLIAVALETIPEVLKGEATATKAVPGQPRGGYLDELTEVPALSGGSLGVWGPQGGLALAGATKCPSCGEVALVREEGCYKCQACGYSKCG